MIEIFKNSIFKNSQYKYTRPLRGEITCTPALFEKKGVFLWFFFEKMREINAFGLKKIEIGT